MNENTSIPSKIINCKINTPPLWLWIQWIWQCVPVSISLCHIYSSSNNCTLVVILAFIFKFNCHNNFGFFVSTYNLSQKHARLSVLHTAEIPILLILEIIFINATTLKYFTHPVCSGGFLNVPNQMSLILSYNTVSLLSVRLGSEGRINR